MTVSDDWPLLDREVAEVSVQSWGVADDAWRKKLGETATVILFKASGKYYTEEPWRIPPDALGPFDMERSPDFRRIGGGAVLVETQEPWGYPHLFPGGNS